MTDFPPSFPRTKLHRPRVATGWIPRLRLMERLDQVLRKPVALISAPAGFGKTILISQWLDSCKLPNAWLQLDEGDHENPGFMMGLTAALRQLFPGCLQRIADLTLGSGTIPISVWKNALIDGLELLEGEPFILALDDYHLVSNPSIDLLLADVLSSETLPLHLIISARRSPSLSFSRLRVQGKVVEVSTADLRFTASETLAYVNQAVDVTLSAEAVDQLQDKTEGWAAGLALVAISLREEAQPEKLIAHLGGADRGVSDYLLNQVFHNQPVEIQEFLLKTASFNQFCAAMLFDVFDSKQSEGELQALLERIEAAQLFLIHLDDHRAWFRYHHLFREMLLAHQRYHFSPEQIEGYQRRAAEWLIHQGQKDEALGYLVALQDWTGAAKVVESQFRSLLNAEDFQGIQRRLGYFREDFIATRPGLLLMQAWMAHFELRLVLMRSLTVKLQTLLDAALRQNQAADSDALLPRFEIIPHNVVQANIWVMEGAWYLLTNQGSQAVSVARQATDSLPENWLFTRGNAMLYLGMSMCMEGQYHQAVELLMEHYHRLQDPGRTYGLRLLFCVASIHVLHGELELARQASEQMLRDAQAFNLPLMQGWGYYGLWRVYQEWNQLERAASNVQLAVNKRYTSNLFCSLESIASYVLVQHTLGDREQAQQSLDLFQDLYAEKSTPTPAMVMALDAWLKLKDGRLEEARRWAESFTSPITEQSIIWYHIPHLYKAKILLEISEPETDKIVDQLLDEIQELAERTHNTYTLVRVLAMRAVWLHRQGENDMAQQTLARALRLARPGWFILTFVEQGPEMLELLLAAMPRLQPEAGLGEYIDKLIAAFPKPTDPPPTTSNLNEIKIVLTDRELEVLELLAKRLSIKEIATRLHISPSTVQQHTHHIYRKLNVNNKRQAVLRATELGILPKKR